ncbi:MAG: hypothetical protein Q8Q12_08670 [bacterium]|nr:hypothetical protein [bacterium]
MDAEVMPYGRKMSVLRQSQQGSRFHCPRLDEQVLCKRCCIERLGGHWCYRWSLCTANDLSQCEW